MRLIIVGQSHARFRPGARRGDTLVRLGEWLDEVGVRYYSFVNATPYGMKRPDLVHLARAVEGYDLLVALGQVPARALHSIGKAHYALPHPSGLNRKLNDAAFVRESIEGLRTYLHEEHVT